MIHMKCQDLFSRKKKKMYLKMPSAAVVIGALKVKNNKSTHCIYPEYWDILIT